MSKDTVPAVFAMRALCSSARPFPTTLMRLGWGTDDPTFPQVFTSWQLPAATREQADAYNELQRMSASPDSAVRYWETAINIDVRDLLGQVKVPTLVFH